MVGNNACITLLLGFLLNAVASERQSIRLSDDRDIAARRPIIVAHRGGVVSANVPECSLTAIRLAADAGYDMVELDVRKSSDGVPMVFHDRSLLKACGKSGRIADYTATELESITYLAGSTDRIVPLEAALETCRRLGLGVMLDLKTGQDSREFLELIDRLLVEYELTDSAISFSGSTAARRFLKHVRFPPTDAEMQKLRAGETLDLRHRFWFGLPSQLRPGDVVRLKSCGALVIPAINTFRYPADRHLEAATDDIKRLAKEGVDGFQIDSVYFSLLRSADSLYSNR